MNTNWLVYPGLLIALWYDHISGNHIVAFEMAILNVLIAIWLELREEQGNG